VRGIELPVDDEYGSGFALGFVWLGLAVLEEEEEEEEDEDDGALLFGGE
jgi:hypothetical protein